MDTLFRGASTTYKISRHILIQICVQNVNAVLFLAALSGYDQGLIEDRDSNQMQEALMLFDSICNSSWFAKASMIL